MSTLTIAHHPTAPATQFAATLASLPLSFAPEQGGTSPDTVVVDGSGDWASAASIAVEQGARAVMISRPGPNGRTQLARLIEMAADRHTVVELADAYAGNPVFEKHGEEISAHLQTLAALIITGTDSASPGRATMLSAVRTIRALGLTPRISAVTTTETTTTIQGGASSLALTVSVARSSAALGQRVQGLGFSRTLDIRLYGTENARPAEVTIATMAGENRLSTVYETSERAAWRRAAQRLRAESFENPALVDLASDLDLIQQF